MSSQVVPIHRTNTDSSSPANKHDVWFNAFNYGPGEDSNVRWLSRPNQQLVRDKYAHDTEKFRITFDVENFQPDQIKIYIQNRKLTISGVYEERSEGRFMQKQFERTFDIPASAEVDSMASFITASHMLVVEIPLGTSTQIDHLNINENANNQRRLSFSLNKYDTSNNEGLLSTSNDANNLSASGQQVRRTSMTKTTTTTTTSGSSGLPTEAAELLRNADTTTGNSSQTYSKLTTERHSSNTDNQQVAVHDSNTPSSSSTTNRQTTLTTSELGDLPIDIPPELLASGGTITIQRRRVSVTKGTDGNNDHGVSAPSTHNNETHSTSSTTTSSTRNTDQTGSVPIKRNNETDSTSSTTTNTTHNTDQSGSVQIKRNNETQSTSTNTLNQHQTNTNEHLGSKTTLTSDQSRMFTLEEFLQNKTWNPSLVDGPNGKKILYMRLQMKPGVKSDHMKISLNGYDLRIDIDHKESSDSGRYLSSHSYRQVTLFPTCEMDQLKSELKEDGFLHIQVPITL